MCCKDLEFTYIEPRFQSQPNGTTLPTIINEQVPSGGKIKEDFIKKWVNYAKGYKKRYFVLTPELLLYYKVKNGQVSDKGQISLKLAKVDARTMNEKDKKMIINTGSGQIHLEFNNVQEKKEWYQAIEQCKNNIHLMDLQMQQ